jgi:hypothetical protein
MRNGNRGQESSFKVNSGSICHDPVDLVANHYWAIRVREHASGVAGGVAQGSGCCVICKHRPGMANSYCGSMGSFSRVTDKAKALNNALALNIHPSAGKSVSCDFHTNIHTRHTLLKSK